MSGIVGSRLNIRGSGLVGSLGTDGQALTSSGAGAGMVFEAAGGFAVGDITGATALDAQPASTDELVISDGGVLKRVDFSHLNQHKNFGMMRISEPSTPLSMNTNTLCPFDWDYLVDTDYDVCDISGGEHKYTCPEAGRYFFFFSVRITNGSYNDEMSAAIYVNGGASAAAAYSGGHNLSGNLASAIVLGNSFIYNASANDYLQMYCYSYGSGDSNMANNTCLFGGWQLN